MADSGKVRDPNSVYCDRCGAEVTTGFMVFLCPLRERCEFWGDDWTEDMKAFVRQHWRSDDGNEVR